VKTICQMLGRDEPLFSIEVFPPRTEKGLAKLYETAETLSELGPAYVSVTYGAGGSTSKATLEIVSRLLRDYQLPCMHHLTLVGSPEETLRQRVCEILEEGCVNFLALRGDPPPEMGAFEPCAGGFRYAYELIGLIREEADRDVCIGVAGFPEGHLDASSLKEDTAHLKCKIDRGGQFVITQLFFENELYDQYLDRLRGAGVRAPVIPGILPIIDFNKLENFCTLCGATIPPSIRELFEPLRDDPEAMAEAGYAHALAQCRGLLDRGAPGIHFYCLNRVEPVRSIWQQLLADRKTSASPGPGQSPNERES
jgi:methylenetetrahydrofolate reductase (NADPH)